MPIPAKINTLNTPTEVPYTMLAWNHIDHVLLDMDGTLLDLHFDNHFWLEYVPQCYSRLHGLSLEEAKAQLMPRYRAVEGTMDWYCIDYWTRELNLDIAALKREIKHMIRIHTHAVEFLDALRQSHRQVLLVTNAHSKSLALKMEETRLASHFDALICAHDLGYPKEDDRFWPLLQQQQGFDPKRTLFVDDSLSVLRSAARYGIGHLLAIRKPDSRGPARIVEEFPSVDDFRQLAPKTPEP